MVYFYTFSYYIFFISNRVYKIDSISEKVGPIDIDDLHKTDEVTLGGEDNRLANRSFSDTYTRAKVDSQTNYQETAELLSGIPPDVAKKFGHLKDSLKNITPKEKKKKSESE